MICLAHASPFPSIKQLNPYYELKANNPTLSVPTIGRP